MPEQYGATLAGLRNRAGLTQRALATRIGIDHSTIASIEKNRRNPGFEVLLGWLDACGARLAVIGPDGEEPMAAILRAVRELGEERRPLVARVVTALAQLPPDVGEREVQFLEVRAGLKALPDVSRLAEELGTKRRTRKEAR